MDPLHRIICDWCSGQSPPDARSWVSCGAQLDIKNLVSDSGWREAPRLKDMSEVRFGSSVCQVEGDIVPVADVTLGEKNSVFFEHHVMLWKDESVPLGTRSMRGGLKRLLGGMPYMVSTAYGPGRIAFSRDANGELVIMPLHPEMELDVRGHAFLLCSHSVE